MSFFGWLELPPAFAEIYGNSPMSLRMPAQLRADRPTGKDYGWKKNSLRRDG
ncbi:MAG TPA: hypothetical protein VF596_03320 [Pyrinomonadaceae bacterium]